jgi:hypothetical protein
MTHISAVTLATAIWAFMGMNGTILVQRRDGARDRRLT